MYFKFTSTRMVLRQHHCTKRRPNLLRCFHFKNTVLDELADRGLTSQITRPARLATLLALERQIIYLGIDPTAPSLHVGHLLPLICLLHFQCRGHKVISVVGGATGLVGDPSGKLVERVALDQQKAEQNIARLSRHLQQLGKRVLDYVSQRLTPSNESNLGMSDMEVINNMDWFKDISLITFLTTLGRRVRLNTMLSRESVQRRLNSQQGISFTEFTYQLMQAYDFYHLHDKFSCTVQVGGSDQWGNIIAGIELINSKNEDAASSENDLKAYGITTPLLTTSSGQKFGKSDGNAIWLDEKLTSVLDFYQFFLRTPDSDVGRFLKLLTFVSVKDIDKIMEKHATEPEKRMAQRLLANEVTQLVHGLTNVHKAQLGTKVLFDMGLTNVRADDLISALEGDPRLVFVKLPEILGKPIDVLAASYKLVNSRSEAQRLIANQGLYLNNVVVENKQLLSEGNMLDDRVIVLRAGKSKHCILALK